MSERAERIRSGDLALEARLNLPEGDGPFAGVVLCHPHPQYGGEMDNNVVVALRDALTERGIATLRFNFRGVGRSEGGFDGGRGEAQDVAAALAHLAALVEVDPSRIGLAGYSFGAMMALAAVDEGARALALVSLPLQWAGHDRLAHCAAPLLLVAGDDDPVTTAQQLRALAAGLPRPPELHIVPGADHSWWGHERQLGAIAGGFFARHLAKEEA